MKPATDEARQLMHDGTLALAEMEENGVAIDREYLRKAGKKIDRKVERIEDEKLKPDPIWKRWRKTFGDGADLGNRNQLVDVLVDVGLLKDDDKAKRTAKNKKLSGDKDVLSKIDHQFVRDLLDAEALRHLKRSTMRGLERAITPDGLIHSSFNLHLVSTYRSSCDSPNLQNIPIRNPLLASIIRRAFIPRDKNRCLVEIDFSGIEVRVSACYNRDPVLIKYIEDPTTDMHRDMASEIYAMAAELVTKPIRHASKNQFVFPEFYGSYYKQCAPPLWDAIDRYGFTVGDVPMKEHLKAQGIRSRGDCDPEDRDRPKSGTFEAHLQQIERSFWDDRFCVYKDWKNAWFDEYCRKGGCRTLTGFVLDSVLNKKEISNYPIQGSAFHCLLWALIRITRRIKKLKLDAKPIIQIHDSVISDVRKSHVADYVAMARKIMVEELARCWDWLIVPLEVEAEVAPAGRSWHEKAHYDLGA